MARGQRKKPLEKLQQEFEEVVNSIAQYEGAIITLKEKCLKLKDEINIEEYKEFSTLLESRGLSLQDAKDIINQYAVSEEKQSA